MPGQEEQAAILNRRVEVGLKDKVTCELRLEAGGYIPGRAFQTEGRDRAEASGQKAAGGSY